MDPYKVLGISSDATDEEVKKAYRELSRKYHPDANANNPLKDLAEEKFKEVQAAYSQIMDMRAKGYATNDSQTSGGYSAGYQGQGYQGQGYQGQNSGQGYNPYQRGQYQSYGGQYGRDPYAGNECGTGNLCCDLWCADTLCECICVHVSKVWQGQLWWYDHSGHGGVIVFVLRV